MQLWQKLLSGLNNGLKLLSRCLIAVYRATLAGWMGGNCRYFPSCSHYADEALQTHNILYATGLILRRLWRCRPFGPSGYDPVPVRGQHV